MEGCKGSLSKSGRTNHQHEGCVSLRHHMERKLQELQGELACQKQVKLLTRELEALRETGMKASESLLAAELVNLQLEKEDRYKNWELNDSVAVRNAWEKEASHADKKKDALSASLEEAPIKQFKKLKKQIRELQMRQKSLEVKLHRKERNHSACVREKDALIKKYKQQLSVAAEQEQLLEQSKTHTELDWQLCGNAENHQDQKSEELTPSVSLAREQAEAGLQKTDYGLHEVESAPSAFPVKRQQFIQSPLSNCGVLPEGEQQTFQSDDKSCLRKDIPGSEIQKLQQQNANLRAVIAQMRKEMESLDEQTASSVPRREQSAPGHTAGIPPHTAAVLMGRAEGSLCTDQVSGRTVSSDMNVSSASLRCVLNPGTEKGSNNRVMGKEVIDFGSASEDCCPGGGIQHGVSCTPQGTPNKQKEAVRKMSGLSQEKQQLTEMASRLRTDLGMILKEGLGHPVSPKLCTVCVGSGGLSPKELVKRTQCQLSALRHLQHKLITQELQCAKQQHLSRISSLIACPILKGEKAPRSCGEETELLSAEVQLNSSAGNYGPKQQKAAAAPSKVQSQPPKESPGQAQQVWISSSGAHSPCQVEFEIMHSTERAGKRQEHGSATSQPEMPTARLAVRGTKLEVQQKLKSRSSPCTYPIKRKISPTVAKIRNYNIKD
ncbi:coiled-coil domain-containing protein 57 [Centrocercus urophasianus]|uniref:coiled-coil domain-containing protein 57 n=1 Tax=Centrocercus urophasianus TaxID=9002 RepID=UPI001C648728|nr:coiled-coil domain-containing protein 57 [Centrocercus urophasianus]